VHGISVELRTVQNDSQTSPEFVDGSKLRIRVVVLICTDHALAILALFFFCEDDMMLRFAQLLVVVSCSMTGDGTSLLFSPR